MDHSTYVPHIDLQPPAVDFIETSLDKYHQAFSTPPSRYDPHLGGFIVQTPPSGPLTRPPPSNLVAMHNAPATLASVETAESDESLTVPPRASPGPVEAFAFWDSLFTQAMQQFVMMHPDEPEHLVKTGQGIREKQNWTQVLDQIETARNDYSKTDKSFKAGFRRVYRKLVDHAAEPANRATKLVPGGGDLGAVAVTPIIGCVQILLEAAIASSKTRNTMTKAFDRVEAMFSDIELFIQLYPGDKNIEKASTNLIASTLFAAENVLGFFMKGTLRRFLTASVQRENYEKKTIESLQDIQVQCEQLLQEAEKSNKHQEFHTRRIMLDRSAATQATVQRIPHDVRNIVLELLDELDQRYLLQQQQNAQALQTQVTNLFLTAATDAARITSISRPSTPALAPWPVVQHILTSQDILQMLDPQAEDTFGQDIAYIAARRKTHVSPQDQARAESLIRTQQLRAWLTAPDSAQLLVHGSYDRRAYISGLSLFVLSLLETLAERGGRVLPMGFFCGLHVETLVDNTNTGAKGILQSLIKQLLGRWSFTGGEQNPILASEFDEGRIARVEVGELCRLFEGLIRRLPGNIVIFCLIDGVVYYERPEFRDEMAQFVVMLLRLSEDPTVAVVIKALFTSPTRTVDIRACFTDDLILSMEGMARSDLVASSSRLGRELEDNLW